MAICDAILQLCSTVIQPYLRSRLRNMADRRKALADSECRSAISRSAGPNGEIVMKSVSRFALAFAIASLSPMMVSAVAAQDQAKPAKAKKEKAKKEKAPEAYKASPSKEFQAVYNPIVQAYVKKKDAASAGTAKAAFPQVKAAIVTDDDRYLAGNLAQDIANVLNGDKAMRSEAMELLIASTKTPDAEKRTAYYIRGALAYDAQNWPTAIADMQKAYDLGFRQNSLEGGIEILIADSLGQQKKYAEALEWMKKSEAGSKVAGAKPLPANFDTKIARFALNSKDYKLIGPAMQTLVRRNPTTDYWHDALMQTYTNVDLDSQETLDLMRLLRSVGAMKYQQNYSAYATDSIATYFPTEIKGLLDEGFAKGTITKTNATFGGLYSAVQEKLKTDPFIPAQLDKDIAGAKNGYDAAVSGDIALSVGEYAKAKMAYEAALTKGSIVDRERKDLTERTTMRLGMAKLKLGDLVGAKADFAKMASPTRKAVADFWTIYADQLQTGATPPAK
jgi:hypothetical protein